MFTVRGPVNPPFPADATHARLVEHSTSSSLKVEHTMAALTMSANMVVAAKAQRVGGVRRIAAKTAVARVGGLKAPVSLHMRKGTRPSRARDAFSNLLSERRDDVGRRSERCTRPPARIAGTGHAPAKTSTLGLPAPVVAHFL